MYAQDISQFFWRDERMSCCRGSHNQAYEKLNPVFDKYRDKPGSLISVLQEAQELYGYLSMELMDHIAHNIGVKSAKVHGVATFYTQFRLKPVGKYLILLCKGTACHVNGADAVKEAITEELKIEEGETTEDNLFTLNNVACLGCCSLSPVMMINGETFGKLTPAKTKEILRGKL